MVLKENTYASSPSSDNKNILSLVKELSQNQLKIEAYTLSTRGQQEKCSCVSDTITLV